MIRFANLRKRVYDIRVVELCRTCGSFSVYVLHFSEFVLQFRRGGRISGRRRKLRGRRQALRPQVVHGNQPYQQDERYVRGETPQQRRKFHVLVRRETRGLLDTGGGEDFTVLRVWRTPPGEILRNVRGLRQTTRRE